MSNLLMGLSREEALARENLTEAQRTLELCLRKLAMFNGKRRGDSHPARVVARSAG